MHRDAGGVVAAVLELLQAGEEELLHRALSDVADDAAHGPSLRSSSDAEPRPAARRVQRRWPLPAELRSLRLRPSSRLHGRDEAVADRVAPPRRSAPRPSRARAARCRSGARARGRGPRAPRASRSTASRTSAAPAIARRGRATRTLTSRCGSFSIASRSARSRAAERLERQQRARRCRRRTGRSRMSMMWPDCSPPSAQPRSRSSSST